MMKKLFLRFHGALFCLLVSISIFSNRQENNNVPHQFQLYASSYSLDTVNQNNIEHDNAWYTYVSHSTVSQGIASENNRSTITEAQLYNAITLAAIKSKLTRNQYLKFYGVEQPVFKRLVNESLEYAKNWIISDRKLTKEQRLRVWDACCATKWFQKEQKCKGRMNIEKEFDKQQKKEEAARALSTKQVQKSEDVKKAQYQKKVEKIDQQELEAVQKKENINQNPESNLIRFTNQKTILQQRLEDFGIDPKQYVYLPSGFEMLQEEYLAVENVCDSMILIDASDSWSLRKAALQKTKDENFVKSWQETKISYRAKAYLQSHNLKQEMYTRCYGTALQQEINRKNCEILELVAQKQHDMLSKSTFLDYAMQCVDASWWANEFEAIVLAAGLQDLGNQCCHVGDWIIGQVPLYVKAITDGVVESVDDFLDMVSHPVDTINSFAKAAYFVTETLALYDPELWLDNADIFEPFQKQRQELISSMVSAGIHSIKDADGPQRVKMATKFVSDCIFQHKALQVVGAVAGVLRTQAGAMRTMEFVNDIMGSELAYAGVTEKIAQITEELEAVVQKSAVDEIVNLSAKSDNIACKNSMQSSVYGLSEEFALITKQNITQKIKNIMKPSLSEVEELAVKYSKILTEIEGVLQDVLIDIEHIFIPEVKPRWKYDPIAQKRTLDEFFVSGWHHGYLEQFEQAGLFKIRKKVLKNDCVYVEYSWDYGKKIMKKTLFPDHWTKQQIIDRMLEIIKNPASCIDSSVGDRLEKTFLGVTSEGIEIELVLKKEVGQKNWELATGFVSKDYILKG